MIKTVRQLKDLIRSLSEKKTRVAERILIFILMLGFFAYSISLFADDLIYINEKI